MKLFAKPCPLCAASVEFTLLGETTECSQCGRTLTLHPDFLATISGKLLFFSGALLLGSTLCDINASRDFMEPGMGRVVVDLLIGFVYFLLCRFLFFLFQRPVQHGMPQAKNKNA
jgi:hypothetical protein